jgi:hypothetical protein
MDFKLYLPCQPHWICEPFLLLFSMLVGIGILLFIRLVYREYKNVERAKKVHQHRKVHYKIRKNMERPYPPRQKRRPRKP